MPPKSTKKGGVRIDVFKEPQKGPKTTSHNYVHYTIPTFPSDKMSLNSSKIVTNGAPNMPLDGTGSKKSLISLTPLDSTSSTATNNNESGNKSKGDEALHDFAGQIDLFLSELLIMDGRGPFADDLCLYCQSGHAQYECLDCFGRSLMCSECMVSQHATLYLHRIQKWNGNFFSRLSLKDLGLRIQLGHPVGVRCPNPERCREDVFTIVDVYGVHDVSIDFCACGQSEQRHIIQLLRARIFPATIKDPRSGATFQSLAFFEILAYEAKTSAYELFQAIWRCTDNTGTVPCKDRYHALIRMLHEWRHLKMLKRSARGHDPDGVQATKEGECAVICPACPHPGKNMVPNWKTDGSARYLHQLFLSIDACFRHKRKNVSNNEADPGLVKGYSYFVEESAYKQFLKLHKNDIEPKSSCSRHDAVNMSEKSSQGYAATGISAVVCSRHDMKRPTSVGDLQKGERYCNMDYVFRASLRGDDEQLEYITIGYDIVCQWEIKFPERMRQIDPSFFVLNDGTNVRFLVPKFHLPAHVNQCRLNYSYNLTAETGRTEGEATERGWVYLNGLASSTREMGPGSRRDTLDYHMGDENWRKVTDIGSSLAGKLYAAALDMAEHVIAHNELTRSIPTDHISQWQKEVDDWNKVKHTKKTKVLNPYAFTASGPSEASVRRELAEEEDRELAAGRDMSLDEKVTPSVLISTGMELEHEQRSLQKQSKKIWSHSQDRQRTQLLLKTNAFQRKLEAWMHYLTLYVPGITRIVDEVNSDPKNGTFSPYNCCIWLPSKIESKISVPRRFQLIEFRLRHSQAHEAIDQLQTQLQIRAHLLNYKYRFVRGQGPNTRMNHTIQGVNSRIDQLALEYRTAYRALELLSPLIFDVGWKKDLQPLLDDDLRDLSEGRKTKKRKAHEDLGEAESTNAAGKGIESEGRRVVSWIWRKGAIGEDDTSSEFQQDRLRSEWCKSAARAERFKEEVCLLVEEMMRVWRFFIWKQERWTSKASETEKRDDMSDMQIEGLRGYALRQADMYKCMREHAQSLWAPMTAHVERMQAIIRNPDLALPGEFDKSYKASTARQLS